MICWYNRNIWKIKYNVPFLIYFWMPLDSIFHRFGTKVMKFYSSKLSSIIFIVLQVLFVWHMVWNHVNVSKVQTILQPNLASFVAKNQEKASLACPLLSWTRLLWMFRICFPSQERLATTIKAIVTCSKNVARCILLVLWPPLENFRLVSKV